MKRILIVIGVILIISAFALLVPRRAIISGRVCRGVEDDHIIVKKGMISGSLPLTRIPR